MNNPYFYRPQPSSLRAADDVFKQIASRPHWRRLFEQGKMLGVLVYSRVPFKYICAYSGVINGLDDPDQFFVPPVYDLQNPDDFYLQKDAEITRINQDIASLCLKNELGSRLDEHVAQLDALRTRRKELSIALQMEIFSHFNFTDHKGCYKNIVDIFRQSKRGLPPGGSGECAAPRLLQYAHTHGIVPLEMAEFWFGNSPRNTMRVHGQYYPSCIEKCSPILRYMTQGMDCDEAPAAESPHSIANLDLLYEDDYLVIVNKPAGVLSVPGKVSGDSVEQWLHARYPEVKGPMLVHRLDQSTSGIMLATKDGNTHKVLQQSFESRNVHKEYVAWLDGKLPSLQGVIHLPICPNPDDRPRQTVDFQFGKQATTYYEVLGYADSLPVQWTEISATLCSTIATPPLPSYTLVRFSPLTGRTHQLRLHAASHFGLGHSIVGDRIYGGSAHSRLMLHAHAIEFEHPVSGEHLRIEAPL